MKKVLLTLLIAAGFATASNAQLAEGSVFPDFTLTSITGQTINLYTLLNSGKTVFIDISATWCPPCWAYHISGALDTLYKQHGPTGWANVDATTTNDVVVLFVQGEATSHLAELYGDVAAGAILYAGTEIPYAQVTQGNWVANTTYPIIDDTTSTDPIVGTAALDAAWHIAYFPTVYMICRDHLVHVMNQPTAAVAYAASLATCPNYAPPAVDAKATAYTGQDYYYCNATPSVSFQNYGTNPITTATITVTDQTGATVVTMPWTGSLATYAIATVPVTSFAGTSFSGYKYSVAVTGDTHLANNVSVDSVFKVYDPSNAQSIPYSENFESGTNAFKYDFPDAYGLAIVSNTLANPANPNVAIDIIGTSGTQTNALWFDNYDATNPSGDNLSNYTINFVFGNYNVSKASLAFDYSYAPKSGSSSGDKLEVQVSTDCGSTWSTAWSATGTTLGTATAISSNWFVPSAASQWKHEVVNLDAYASNDLMIQIESVTASSGNGELVYVDNLTFANTTEVPTVTVSGDIEMYPNPAKDMATIKMNLNETTNVTVEVTDAVGRTINTIAQELSSGTQTISVSTSNMTSGLYNVKISAGSVVTTKQLTVIK